MLVSNGMFESQAREVMVVAEPELEALVDNYKINLEDSVSSYPQAIYNVLYGVIKPVALRWIDGNIPMAWYRPMFE